MTIPAPSYVVGLDLGQSQDYTALAVLERTWREAPDRGSATGPLRRPLLAALAPRDTRIHELLGDWPPWSACRRCRGLCWHVDQTGVGHAVVDMIRQAERAPRSGRFSLRGEPDNRRRGRWHVPKKELVVRCRFCSKPGRLKIAMLPERDLLLKELASFRVKITTAGNETFEAWRDRDHDDLVLAVALACWLGERSVPLQVPKDFTVPRRTLEDRFAARGRCGWCER